MIHLNCKKLFLCYRQGVSMAAALCHSLRPQTIMQQVILIIIALIVSLYALLLFYFRWAWSGIPVFISNGEQAPVTRISIIIPARNEALNIKACLDSICLQQYPAHLFEVLVVDDHSTDNTANIVSSYAAQNVKLISLQDYVSTTALNSYKKKAIEIAIERSSGELIITTDADSIVPPRWLATIAAFYEKNHSSFIVMPVCFTVSNNFLPVFQSLDFMTLQGITGAAVHKKILSMCNGANLAYTRAAFDKVNGFTDIDTIASGDDMLLMHKIYTAYPAGVHYLRSGDVIVHTAPMHTLKDFFNQRIRWASKADKYDDKRMLPVLMLVYFFNLVLLLLPILALFDHSTLLIINYQLSIYECWLWLLLLKTVTELFFLYPVAAFFKQVKLLWWFPFMQPFHIVYMVIAGWLGKFGSYQWKGRNVR